jgi:hypothetical protein
MIELQAASRSAEYAVAGSHWWCSWPAALSGYAVLLRLLVDGRISAAEFEVLFLQLYDDDALDWTVQQLDVLESLFADLEEFRARRAPRSEPVGIGELELRNRAAMAFERLSAMTGGER